MESMTRAIAKNPFSKTFASLALALIGLAVFSGVQAETRHFTQIGSGIAGDLAFRTLLQITNENGQSAQGVVQLRRYDGLPLVVPVEVFWLNEEGTMTAQNGRIEFQIPPASSLQLTINPGAIPLVGQAILGSQSNLAATALSQFATVGPNSNQPGGFEEKLVSEVESAGTSGERSFSFPLVYRSSGRGIDTAFALVNLASESTTVSLLRRPDERTELVLAPGEAYSGYLSQIWPLGAGEKRYDGLAEVRSGSPLGFLVFRTLGGVPLSGVKPAILSVSQEPSSAELDLEFTLAPGQSADIESDDLRVTFDGVLGDSRCPSDVTCVWAGEAISAVTLRQGATVLGQANLILPDVQRSTETFGAYRVTAVRLDPYPNTENGPIRAEDYRLTVLVEKLPD